MNGSNGTPTSASAFATSFYNDSESDAASQLSPGFRPGTAFTGNTVASDSPDLDFGDERRPSVASVTTVNSINTTGSKSSSNRIHKKLHSKHLRLLFTELCTNSLLTSSGRILMHRTRLCLPMEKKLGHTLLLAAKGTIRSMQILEHSYPYSDTSRASMPFSNASGVLGHLKREFELAKHL
jgi:hypothetical protein